MPTEIRIYYEGHGLLNPGFSTFFSDIRDRARENGCSVRLIQTNGTPDRDFSFPVMAEGMARGRIAGVVTNQGEISSRTVINSKVRDPRATDRHKTNTSQ
jgi:glycine/D-amino acid oxidase-like deaminating enzyme